MTRFFCFVTACALTGVITGAAIAACGGRLGSPGELPPLAPRPGPADPTAMPVPRAFVPAAPSRTASPAMAAAPAATDATPPLRGPMVAPASVVPTPEFAPVVGQPNDAGTGDADSPPLPALPDGGVPADGRMEPRLQDR